MHLELVQGYDELVWDYVADDDCFMISIRNGLMMQWPWCRGERCMLIGFDIKFPKAVGSVTCYKNPQMN